MEVLHENVALDVVIVGGGAQGLLILEALCGAGYACALVTTGEVGAGQTLHSHGFLNTGFGLAGPTLARAATEIVAPDLRTRGVPLQENWVVLAPPDLPQLAALPAAPLPPGMAPAFAPLARQLPDRSFAKRQLVEALVHGRADRIIRGSVIGFEGRAPVTAVQVQLDRRPETVALRTQAVVVAAGCGSKALLRALVGLTPQVAQIQHRVVHMVCIRAPVGALPTSSVAALPLGLLVAAHADRNQVTWYVTPMELGGPAFDAVPADAAAPVQPALLHRAAAALRTLYPALPTIAGLRIGHYAGYRQDIGEGPGVPLCGIVAGSGNVIAALPSGLVSPWANAAQARDLVRGLVTPRGIHPALPHGGAGVHVGQAVEDRPEFRWMTWAAWEHALVAPGNAAG